MVKVNRYDTSQLEAIAKGDQTAMERLFEQYKQDVFRYCMSILSDYHAAEDVTQEVFLHIFRFAQQYKGQAAIRTWIFAIAKNAATEYYRKSSRSAPYLLSEENLPSPAVSVSTQGDFYELLSVLDQDSRSVVAMHLAGGLKHREIACILGKSESAVKKQYSRALKRLQKQLYEEGDSK